MKACKKCEQEKPLSDFGPRKASRDGLQFRCRLCMRDGENERARRRYQRCPEKCKEASKRYRDKNPQKLSEMRRAWYAGTTPEWRKQASKRAWAAVKADPRRRIAYAMRWHLWRAVKQRKTARTFDVLGYSCDELILHLERQFTKGMTWENYGEWHIDHIVPLCAFDAANDGDVVAAFALSNLRPLWGAENLSKQGRRVHLL